MHLLLCGLYAWQRLWDSESFQDALFTLLFSVLFPIVGFFVVWIRNYYAEKGKDKDYEELYAENSFFRDELKVLRPIDKEKELNRVPMGEALLLNDYQVRRKMVMDTLQEERTLDYLEVLKKALENEDSETSHYASSIIMQLQAQVQKQLQERQRAYERNPQDMERLKDYEKDLYQLLSSQLLEKENLRKYFLQYEEISDRLLKKDMPEEEHLWHRIRLCFQEGNFTKAVPLVERYLETYPGSEEAVLCKIQLCILTREHRTLQTFLEGLSQRPVILTQKTLEYIRFFRGGMSA